MRYFCSQHAQNAPIFSTHPKLPPSFAHRHPLPSTSLPLTLTQRQMQSTHKFKKRSQCTRTGLECVRDPLPGYDMPAAPGLAASTANRQP